MPEYQETILGATVLGSGMGEIPGYNDCLLYTSKRLSPRDSFKLTFASFTDAFHGVFQAFGRVETLANRAASDTGADLWKIFSEGAGAGISCVIRFATDDLAVFTDDTNRCV